MAYAKMRTVKETVKRYKLMDPETPINEYFIRKLVKEKKVPSVLAGNKVLINQDILDAYLNSENIEQQEEPIQEYGLLRKVME